MSVQQTLGRINSLLQNAISTLSDEDYQRRVWFRWEGPEVNSYLDTVTYLISKCDLLFKDPTYLECLGEDNYHLLKKLYDLVIEHLNDVEDRMSADDLKEEDLVNDPKWHEIQSIAKELHIKLTEWVKRSSNGSAQK